MNVNIAPLPTVYRDKPKRVWPMPPPIFPDGPPTPEDRALARALFVKLDAQSREWYGLKPLSNGNEEKS
jgi:hypothetical protein